MQENEDVFSLLDIILSKNIGWINTADTKAGFVFLICTSMAGVLATLMPPAPSISCVMLVSMIISFALIGTSVFFLFFVNFPRLEGVFKSMIFFGGISEFSAFEYSKEILKGVTNDILDDMANQCHRTAKIATHKFKYLKISFQLLFLAIVPWLITISLFYQINPPK